MNSVGCHELHFVRLMAVIAKVPQEQTEPTGLATHVGYGVWFTHYAYSPASKVFVIIVSTAAVVL